MKLLTLEEASEMLRLDKRTVRRIIRSGALPAMKAGVSANSPYRISEKALLDYIQRESRKAAKAATP